MNGSTFDSMIFVAGCVSGRTDSNSLLTVTLVNTGLFTCFTFSENKTTTLFIRAADLMDLCPTIYSNAVLQRQLGKAVSQDVSSQTVPQPGKGQSQKQGHKKKDKLNLN